MGHVDHGKTSLLDAIRTAHVADKEAGGITQHIGAYHVDHNGQKIVFIDTPGHEAFTRMRARGAKVTDIVVLVVAADDGVMPQTIEAIDHARAAKVPIIVAINKIDKAEAQVDRIKQQLSDRGLLAEDWGGDTVMVPVSARTKQNLDLLLEMILLVAEIQDLKANPARPAMASVLEAKLDRGRGPVATVLVRNGTLRVGRLLHLRLRVRPRPRHARRSRRAGQGSRARPCPSKFSVSKNCPKPATASRSSPTPPRPNRLSCIAPKKNAPSQLAKTGRITLEQFHKQMAAGEVKELPIILKADVSGSAEVLRDTLEKLSTDKVTIRVIHSGVGAINESDVQLAAASNAIIIGFSVRPERNAAAAAEQEKVDIRLHTIIYEVVDEMKKAMAGPARSGFQGSLPGQSGNPRGLPGFEGRHRRRLPGHGRPDHARFAGAHSARQHRRSHRQNRLAAPVQGRCQRSPRRHGVRHHAREFHRCANRATSLRRSPCRGLPTKRRNGRHVMAVIGVLTLELRIEHAHSLKEKRHVVKGLKDRLRRKFNVSVAEIDDQDLHNSAVHRGRHSIAQPCLRRKGAAGGRSRSRPSCWGPC